MCVELVSEVSCVCMYVLSSLLLSREAAYMSGYLCLSV